MNQNVAGTDLSLSAVHAIIEIGRAELDGRIVGSISIDGEDLDDGLAHLRWFVVDPSIRGGGIGNALLSRAVSFCEENGFDQIHLWTVKGLNAARTLYEKHGFRLAREYTGDQWGSEVVEHKFVRLCRPRKTSPQALAYR